MNRRQKIIVSITGIFIVLLGLVGLTYAYFLTRINGNEKDKSISVTTANLELVYGDGNNKILTKSSIMPGMVVGTKDFTVTNTGVDTSYVVVLEDVSVTYATDGTTRDGVSYNAGDTTTFISNDFVYTLKCTSNIEGNTCNEQQFKTPLPMKDGLILGNNIEEDEVHTYELIVTYEETGIDQTDDMNKALNAKVNIKDIRQDNPYSDNTDSLAYNIINNAKLNKNGTSLVATPQAKLGGNTTYHFLNTDVLETIKTSDLDFGYDPWVMGETVESVVDANPNVSSYEEAVGHYVSDKAYNWIKYLNEYNEETGELKFYNIETKTEKTLNFIQDDYGDSYYYRGAVEDNYVNFANMCWRIVRIVGNGSIKLILEDQYAECDDTEQNDKNNDGIIYTGNWNIGLASFGNDFILENNNGVQIELNTLNYLEPNFLPNSSMVKILYDFQMNSNLKNYSNKLTNNSWCYNDRTYSDPLGENEIKKLNFNDVNYYDSYVRLHNSDALNVKLMCSGTKMEKFKNFSYNSDIITTDENMLVGSLTVDEILLAGAGLNKNNEDFYLINNYNLGSTATPHFFTLSPETTYSTTGAYTQFYEYVYVLNLETVNIGQIGSVSNLISGYVRPSILLQRNITINKGNGLKSEPYVIN